MRTASMLGLAPSITACAVVQSITACAAVLSITACAVAPAAPAPTFGTVLSPLFEADLPEVLARLGRLPPAALDEKQARTRACIEARFGAASPALADDPSLPPLAREALAAYRVYWSDVLMRRVAPERAEQGLRAALARLEPLFGSDAKAGEQALRRRLEAQGWFMLGGRTQPLFEFMLWSRQTRSTERVELPFDSVEVTVTLLDGFASLGWAAWGSCDRSHTGGWVTDEGIMVVAPAWDRTSEAYRVSLIAHEAQHFADLKRYPRLGQPDLEFRAKLVELVLADKTQRELLGAFAAQARRDRALPHPFANHWVIERLRQRTGQGDLPSLPREVVADAARAELVAHAAAVEVQGALRAQSALPD